MPSIPTTYSGDRWEAIRVRAVYAFDSANGRTTINGLVYPRLTNAQALALVQGWKRMLRTAKVAPGPLWPDLWYRALGRLSEGDRFVMTTAHAEAPAPDEVILGAWEFGAYAARRLDEKNAQPRLLVLDFSYRAYEQAARDAYEALKAERKRKKKPPPPPLPKLPDKPPLDPTPPLPQLPTIPKGTGLALLLLLLVLATSKRK